MGGRDGGKKLICWTGRGSPSFNWIQQVWVQVEMQLKRNPSFLLPIFLTVEGFLKAKILWINIYMKFSIHTKNNGPPIKNNLTISFPLCYL